MALKTSDYIYYAPWDVSASADEKREALEIGATLGYYQYTNLKDVIDNFIVAYTGPGKHFERLKRYEVEWHAQRAIQEFNYDILRSTSSVEAELSDRLSLPLPQDFVNYISVSYIDERGNSWPLKPSYRNANSAPYLQDSDYEYMYDSDGSHTEAEHSTEFERWRDKGNIDRIQQSTLDYYYGYYNEDEYSYFHNRYFGRRFGANAQDWTRSGTFIFDDRLGQIHFDSSFNTGDLVSLQYVSDGLKDSADFDQVFIHKFAEDAIYSYLLWGLSRGRKDVPEYVVNRYKKDKATHMRNAKHRLSDLSPNDLIQIFRNKNKWIKH